MLRRLINKISAPRFWYEPKGPADALLITLLSPFTHLYRRAAEARQKAYTPYQSSLPVICVGNIVVGGSGKTPVVASLILLLRAWGFCVNPCILTRGYGGRIRTATLVDAARHDAAAVGDEALLLARTAPVIVSADRAAGAKLAEKEGFDLIVMDDGMQNPGLLKTLTFMVIDGYSGLGNRNLLPAGPLREPLETGLTKADIFVMMGADRLQTRGWLPLGRPVLNARVIVPPNKMPPLSPSYVAFAGLGQPEKFKRKLESLGYKIAAWRPYPDHYAYDQNDVLVLTAQARFRQAHLITTEKDAVRLPPFPPTVMLHVLPIELAWEDQEKLRQILMTKLPVKA